MTQIYTFLSLPFSLFCLLLVAAHRNFCHHSKSSLQSIARKSDILGAKMKRTNDDTHGGDGLSFVPDEYKFVVIFMHGLGDTARGWADVATMYQRRQGVFLKTKFILPTAGTRPITWNGGMYQNAWADITDLDPKTKEDDEGYYKAAERIHKIVNAEVEEHKIDPKNIIIGGFSQGGAVAYISSLTFKSVLGGIVVMSGWLPLKKHETRPLVISENAKHIPLLACHGSRDPLVQPQWGVSSANSLKDEIGMNVEVKMYPIAHGADEDELDEVGDFIQKIFENDKR